LHGFGGGLLLLTVRVAAVHGLGVLRLIDGRRSSDRRRRRVADSAPTSRRRLGLRENEAGCGQNENELTVHKSCLTAPLCTWFTICKLLSNKAAYGCWIWPESTV